MKKSTLLFVTILISFFPFGDLFAKGKVKVDKALEHAARQYLYMRSELQGSNQFPKTYDKHMQRLKTSNSAFIPELYSICTRIQETRSYMLKECVC